MYKHFSPSLYWSVSNKPSDSQSNCSQRVQPQALLPRTHTHSLHELKKVLASAQYILAISQPHFCNFALQSFWPLFSPPSMLSLSLAVSISSFHTPSIFCLSVQPLLLFPPSPFLSLRNIQSHSKVTASPQPASSVFASQNQILAWNSHSATSLLCST